MTQSAVVAIYILTYCLAYSLVFIIPMRQSVCSEKNWQETELKNVIVILLKVALLLLESLIMIIVLYQEMCQDVITSRLVGKTPAVIRSRRQRNKGRVPAVWRSAPERYGYSARPAGKRAANIHRQARYLELPGIGQNRSYNAYKNSKNCPRFFGHDNFFIRSRSRFTERNCKTLVVLRCLQGTTLSCWINLDQVSSYKLYVTENVSRFTISNSFII